MKVYANSRREHLLTVVLALLTGVAVIALAVTR